MNREEANVRGSKVNTCLLLFSIYHTIILTCGTDSYNYLLAHIYSRHLVHHMLGWIHRQKLKHLASRVVLLQAVDEAGHTVIGLKVDDMFLSIKNVGKFVIVKLNH